MVQSLIHHPLCPFCRKARLFLNESKIEYQLVEEKFWEKSPKFLDLNPMGTVPVFVLDSGATIIDSQVIIEYVNEKYNGTLIGKTPEHRAEVRRLTKWFDEKFNQEVTKNIVVEKFFKRMKKQGNPQSTVIKFGKSNMVCHLDYMAYLLERRSWLAGEQLTLVDLAAAAQLSAIDYFGDIDWDYNEYVKNWYMLIKSRPSFRPILNDKIPALPPVGVYKDLDF